MRRWPGPGAGRPSASGSCARKADPASAAGDAAPVVARVPLPGVGERVAGAVEAAVQDERVALLVVAERGRAAGRGAVAVQLGPAVTVEPPRRVGQRVERPGPI